MQVFPGYRETISSKSFLSFYVWDEIANHHSVCSSFDKACIRQFKNLLNDTQSCNLYLRWIPPPRLFISALQISLNKGSDTRKKSLETAQLVSRFIKVPFFSYPKDSGICENPVIPKSFFFWVIIVFHAHLQRKLE